MGFVKLSRFKERSPSLHVGFKSCKVVPRVSSVLGPVSMVGTGSLEIAFVAGWQEKLNKNKIIMKKLFLVNKIL